jgi:hypothetical protein
MRKESERPTDESTDDRGTDFQGLGGSSSGCGVRVRGTVQILTQVSWARGGLLLSLLPVK